MLKFKIDKEAIELLCKLMNDNSLSEIEIKNGSRSIKLSKSNKNAVNTIIEKSPIDIEKKNIVDLGIRTKITVIPHGIELLEEKKKSLNSKRTKKAIFFSRIHEKKGLL